MELSFLLLSTLVCLQTWVSSPLVKSSTVASACPPCSDQPVLYTEERRANMPYEQEEYFPVGAVPDKRRLRFVRRNEQYVRDMREPRLRFVKRAAGIENSPLESEKELSQTTEDPANGLVDPTQDGVATSVKEQTPTDTAESTKPKSRARRSVDRQKRRAPVFSFMLDLDVIRRNVLNKERLRRLREIENLRQMMREKGKRSEMPISSDGDEDDAAADGDDVVSTLKDMSAPDTTTNGDSLLHFLEKSASTGKESIAGSLENKEEFETLMSWVRSLLSLYETEQKKKPSGGIDKILF